MTERESMGEERGQDQRLVRDLRRMFYDSRESTDFLTRLYSRLEARQGDVPVIDRLEARQGDGSGIDATGEAAGSQFPRREAGKNKGRERRPWQQMVGAIAAVFIVTLLVSSLIFVFNRTRQTSSIGSHPNMQTSATIASLHMLDEQSGWALSDKDLILRTTDSGLHWKNVSPSSLAANPIGTVLNVLDAAHAWVAAPWSDTSHSWIGAENSDPPHLWIVSTGDDITQTQIFSTSDGGQTWKSSILQTSVVTQITFSDARTGWLLSRHAVSQSAETVEVWHSSDGGQSWTQTAAALASSADAPAPGHLPFGGKKNGIGFLDSQTGWITGASSLAGHTLLYRTQDSGKTWSPQALHLSAPESTAQLAIAAPHFFSATEGILPVSVNGASGAYVVLYATHDAGNSWQRTAPIVATVSLADFVDANHGWISDGTHLYATSSGGKQWREVTTNPPLHNVSSLDFVTQNVGWAIGSTQSQSPALLKTGDGGQSWTVLSTIMI